MGRKPIGEKAMTAAERMRLWRLKHAPAKPVAKPQKRPVDSAALAAEVARLKARIVALEDENAALRGARKRQPRQ